MNSDSLSPFGDEAWQFEAPFFLLLLIPLLAIQVVLLRRRSARGAILFSDSRFIARLPRTLPFWLSRSLPWIQLLGWCALIIALARPRQGIERYRIPTEGIAIEMCIDRSGSMEAEDFILDGERVNRLAAVKHAFREFVLGNEADLSGRRDDLIGLIAFGGFADDLCPLTLDHEALMEILNQVEIPQEMHDASGRLVNEEDRATAIGDAIVTAIGRLKNVDSESKVLILLSDGANTAGIASPQEAAEAAATHGIKIYTIGVGGEEMLRSRGWVMFRTPNPMRVDEQTLQQIAAMTGGQFFRASDSDGLGQVYREIDQLEKTVTEGLLYMDYREFYYFPLWLGLGLILTHFVMQNLLLRSLP